MKTLNKIILSAFLPLTIMPMIGMAAETPGSANWVNSTGIYWRNSFGECWRSSSWTTALATEACDPELFKKAEAAPPPAPIPDKVVTRNVSFSEEDLFEFNKSELKPEGKEKLDDLIKNMKATENEEIVATGHADRIGNQKYNQQLSERRAEAVRDYLIAGGIPASRIRSEGKGETAPVTKPGECKGSVSKELIACLQPDRRVEVEVNATKTIVLRGS